MTLWRDFRRQSIFGVVTLASTFASSTLPAQNARAGATPIRRVAQHDSATSAYEVGGIRILHRLTPANDVVAANVYLLGGVRQMTAANAGLETLLLEASERGTKEYGKERLRRAIARLGSTIVTNAERDWTMLGLRATRATFDSTWMILASRLVHPTLDPGELDLVREQILTAVRQRADNPEALVAALADSFAFGNHPYSRQPLGTEKSVAAVTIEELKRYHAEQIVKSRMLLVIVGNVPRSRVEQLVARTIAQLPMGQYQWTLPDTFTTAGPGFLVEERNLPTNYILGLYAGPPASNRDYQALRVATAILSGQLYSEIRLRRNLTYAVNAPFFERAIAAGGVEVSTVSPDTTLAVMRQQIAALQEGTIDRDALGRLIQQFITEYFLNNETNAEQATFLARAQLYRGDYRAGERFVDELRQVTPEDIQRVARRYIRNIRFAYVGTRSRLSPATLRGF